MEGLTYHGSSVSDVHLELSQLQTKPKSLISALRSQYKNIMGYWPEICWQLPLDRALSTRCFDLQKFLVHVLVISPFIRIIIRQEANSTNLAFQPFIYLKKRKTAWMLSLMINYVHTQQKLFAMVLFCLWESSLLKHFTDFLFIVHLEIWNDFISQDHLICVSMALRLTGN